MKYRCHVHALVNVEEYALPGALISMHPCVICGAPSVQMYSRRYPHRPKIHLSTEQHGPEDLVLRECRQWDPLLSCGEHVRYDFAYRDPASGRICQYCVSMIHFESSAPVPAHVIETAKESMARELRRKCGLDRAIANQHLLRLPNGVARARYV